MNTPESTKNVINCQICQSSFVFEARFFLHAVHSIQKLDRRVLLTRSELSQRSLFSTKMPPKLFDPNTQKHCRGKQKLSAILMVL